MFNKKRRVPKYSFTYGKSPALSRNLPKQRYSNKIIRNKNPLFSKIKKIAILIILLAGTGLLINSVFFSTYFKINEVKISDKNLENNQMGEEIKKSAETALGKNLIFVNTETLQEKILDAFPEIEEVTIEKDYPKAIIINFSEYTLVANVINENNTVKKTYIVNSIGYAVKEDLENQSLPYIRMKSDEPLNAKTAIIEANKLRYILESKIYFEEKFGMRIIEAQYKKTAREVHLLTERNFTIWLDMQNSIEAQLKKLKKALVKLDIYTENLDYIDLRIAGENGDKIIYKRK